MPLVEWKRQLPIPEESKKRSYHNYHTLRQHLARLVSSASEPQLTNLALFVYGLLATGQVKLSQVALCLPISGPLKNAQNVRIAALESENVVLKSARKKQSGELASLKQAQQQQLKALTQLAVSVQTSQHTQQPHPAAYVQH